MKQYKPWRFWIAFSFFIFSTSFGDAYASHKYNNGHSIETYVANFDKLPVPFHIWVKGHLKIDRQNKLFRNYEEEMTINDSANAILEKEKERRRYKQGNTDTRDLVKSAFVMCSQAPNEENIKTLIDTLLKDSNPYVALKYTKILHVLHQMNDMYDGARERYCADMESALRSRCNWDCDLLYVPLNLVPASDLTIKNLKQIKTIDREIEQVIKSDLGESVKRHRIEELIEHRTLLISMDNKKKRKKKKDKIVSNDFLKQFTDNDSSLRMTTTDKPEAMSVALWIDKNYIKKDMDDDLFLNPDEETDIRERANKTLKHAMRYKHTESDTRDLVKCAFVMCSQEVNEKNIMRLIWAFNEDGNPYAALRYTDVLQLLHQVNHVYEGRRRTYCINMKNTLEETYFVKGRLLSIPDNLLPQFGDQPKDLVRLQKVHIEINETNRSDEIDEKTKKSKIKVLREESVLLALNQKNLNELSGNTNEKITKVHHIQNDENSDDYSQKKRENINVLKTQSYPQKKKRRDLRIKEKTNNAFINQFYGKDTKRSNY